MLDELATLARHFKKSRHFVSGTKSKTDCIAVLNGRHPAEILSEIVLREGKLFSARRCSCLLPQHFIQCLPVVPIMSHRRVSEIEQTSGALLIETKMAFPGLVIKKCSLQHRTTMDKLSCGCRFTRTLTWRRKDFVWRDKDLAIINNNNKCG